MPDRLPMPSATAPRDVAAAPEHPARALLRFRRRPAAAVSFAVLAIGYATAWFAPFLSPYRPDSMDRTRFYHPPQRVHWFESAGRWRGPFVYGTRLADPGEWAYREDRSQIVPIELFVHGEAYRWAPGLSSDRHLFGARGQRVFVFGADAFGRDVLSRLLYGARVSLGVGLIGLAISFTLGLLVGGIAGYAGGWVDALLMRLSDLLLSVPALYLLIALRSAFPVTLPSSEVYVAIVAILALIGWAATARVVRGMVKSIRRADYVIAAEALGLGSMRIMVRHILPNTISFVIVAATAAIPGYILAEVVLSFLGVGVQEPAASWGNMLSQAQSLRVLTSYPWLLAAPAVAIFLTVMSFNLLGDGLRDALDPRGLEESRSR